MQLRRIALLVGLGLMLGAPAWAQNVNSRITGTAKDAQGAVLPGVTVTATSPALIGSQVAVTEANGTYLFPSLPSGTYTVKFELSGFQPFARQNIVLPLGQTLNVDGTLQVATVQENVTVTAEAPVVDTQSTAVGSTLDTAKLIGTPSSSDLWGALAQAPGVRMGAFDIGGSHKSQQSGYSAFGISNQTRVVTEGVDTTEGTGGAGFYQDYFSQNEIAVSGAGQDVTMNTPGAAVISTIKSGGNTFKSLINQTYEGESFVGNNVDPGGAIAKRGGSAQPNLVFWENHDDLGGPIVRDKLWFFVAYNHFKIDKVISGVDPSVATDLGIFSNFTTKETYKASSKDTIIGYYQWGVKHKPLRGLSVTTPKESTLAQTSPSWMYNGKWERVWSNRLFSEFNIGKFGYNFPEQPSIDYKSNPPRTDLVTDQNTGAGWQPFVLEREKPQIYGNATYYLPTKTAGSHDLKMGFEWIDDQSNFAQNGTSGPIQYRDSNGQTSEILLTDVGDPAKLGDSWTVPSDRDRRVALYLQDRWTASSRATITMGVRYDRQRPYYIEAKRDPLLTELFVQQTFPQKTLFVRNNIAPRVALSYDPSGDGRAAFKVFYGRYYFNFADSFSDIDPGGENTKTFEFLDNGNRLYDGPQELGTLLDESGGVSTKLDTSLVTPHTDEFDLSYQHQFWGEAAWRIAYVRKMTRNDYDEYNVAREGQFTVAHTMPVTLRSIDGGVEGPQDFTVYDIPDSLKGQVENVITTLPAAVDFGAANYDTIEVAFNKRFSQGLFLDASYDWTRRDDLRNNSSSNSPLTQSDPISSSYFQNVFPTTPNRQVTSVWTFHLSSRYEFPYEIGLGANFQLQNGWQYSRRINVRLPNAGSQNFWMTDLGANGQRSDMVPVLNVRLDKAFSFAGHRLTGMLDLFNILNAAPIVNFNTSNGSNFRLVNGVLDPRTLQLGVRFEF
jgi:outer membrane receptor protein involved in Fe transport